MRLEKTALQFADWALQNKGDADRFANIPEPPSYARPALTDKQGPAEDATPKQPKPVLHKHGARLRPEVARALLRVAQQRASEAFASPRLTAGWTPKVGCLFAMPLHALRKLPSACFMAARGLLHLSMERGVPCPSAHAASEVLNNRVMQCRWTRSRPAATTSWR